MKEEFEMSMVGKLNFFLGLQVKQTESEIFILQSKYAKNHVQRFGLEKAKHFKTPMNTTLLVILIYVLVLVFVQDINLILKNLILLQLRESLDMLVKLLIMEFGILRILT